MMYGTYIGANKKLQGRTALLREEGTQLLAQFDDLEHFGSKPPSLALGWHTFKHSDFIIDFE